MQVCTFSDNRVQILRCAMCDAVRGTSWDYYRLTGEEASALTERPAADTKETKGQAAVRRGDQCA